MKLKNKIFSCILAICLIFTVIPYNVYANEKPLSNTEVPDYEDSNAADNNTNVLGTDIDTPATDTGNPVPNIIEAEKVLLNKTSITLVQGKTYTLKATVSPKETTDKKVSYTSSQKTIASVNASGLVKALKPGTTTITAKTSNGKMAKCKVTVRLSASTLKVSAVTTTSNKISWKKVTNASGYYIYRATRKSGKYSLIKKQKGNSTFSYKNTNLKPGTTYYYKITAYSTSSKYNSSYSSIVSYKALPKAPVMNSAASVSSKTIKLSWPRVSDASGYCVYKRSGTSGSWTKVATLKSGKSTSYQYTKAKGCYYYAVKSYRTIKKKNYYSPLSSAKRIRVLAKPKIKSVTTTPDDSDVVTHVLKWGSIAGATSYQVYVRKGTSGSYSRAATVKSTKYNYKASTHGVYYYFKIRPVYQYKDAVSYGQFSNAEEQKIYHEPDYSAFMSSNTSMSTSAFVIYITNDGDRTLRIYSKGACLFDRHYDEYDRNLFMYDYKKYEAGKLVKTSYTDIKPGQSAYILLGCTKNTWYDQYSRIYLNFSYEGESYLGGFSSYYGYDYSLN